MSTKKKPSPESIVREIKRKIRAELSILSMKTLILGVLLSPQEQLKKF